MMNRTPNSRRGWNTNLREHLWRSLAEDERLMDSEEFESEGLRVTNLTTKKQQESVTESDLLAEFTARGFTL
jgi:hypothetical protein